MKKKRWNSSYLYPVILAGLVALTSYISCESIWVSLGVGTVFLLAGFLFFLPLIQRYETRVRKSHECYRFVNAFLICLSSTQSLERAFGTGGENLGEHFESFVSELGGMEPKARTEYLATYFESDLYDMFISVLNLYFDQGGDVLRLSSSLMEELTRVEESSRSLEKESRHNLIQYLGMWGLSLGIMVFLRFGLSSFYNYLRGDLLFTLGIVAFYAVMLVGLVLYALAYTGKAGRKKKGEARHG
ncbi:MAG: hypothetical protein HUJ60_03105 [Bacilli bacterium]|nr:hypothetical protein [Bacilli bacterium]